MSQLGAGKESTGLERYFQPIVVLLLTGLTIGNLADLSGKRPAPDKERPPAAGIQLDSRLWMDPFEATKSDLRAGAPHATNHADFGGQLATHVCGESAKCLVTDKPNVQILAVFLGGGPYAESAESRRRTRYAVISGLAVSGYEPEDAQHIRYLSYSEKWQYFDPPLRRVVSQAERKLPDVVPYEWFSLPKSLNSTGAGAQKSKAPSVLVVWLDESALSRTPLKKLATLNNHFVYNAMQSVYQAPFPNPDLPVDKKDQADACWRSYDEKMGLTIVNRKILNTLFCDSPIKLDGWDKAHCKTPNTLETQRWPPKASCEILKEYSKKPIPLCKGEKRAKPACETLLNDATSSELEKKYRPASELCQELRTIVKRELVSPDFDLATAFTPSAAFQLLGHYTVDVLKQLGDDLKQEKSSDSCKSSTLPEALFPPSFDFTILGPTSSDVLEEIRKEAEDLQILNKPEDDRKRNRYYRFRIYSPQASASFLLKKTPENKGSDDKAHPCKSLVIRDCLELRGISFESSILPDSDVASSLYEELQLRGYDKDAENKIVFVGEWDTLYARKLKETFGKQFFGSIKKLDHKYYYGYLRGLDGEGQPRPRDLKTQGDQETQSPENVQQPLDSVATQVRPNTFDQALGDDQIDYLRRIADDIERHDRALRQQDPPGSVRAIGLVGTDVYDKILIMRALRPKFPEALFFTTELDARFADNGAQDGKTRNLIVASSYGLELAQPCQRSIPAFRSATTQTSYFLATQATLNGPCGLSADLKPKLFEIGRTNPIFLSDNNNEKDCENEGQDNAAVLSEPPNVCTNPPRDVKRAASLSGLCGGGSFC